MYISTNMYIYIYIFRWLIQPAAIARCCVANAYNLNNITYHRLIYNNNRHYKMAINNNIQQVANGLVNVQLNSNTSKTSSKQQLQQQSSIPASLNERLQAAQQFKLSSPFILIMISHTMI